MCGPQSIKRPKGGRCFHMTLACKRSKEEGPRYTPSRRLQTSKETPPRWETLHRDIQYDESLIYNLKCHALGKTDLPVGSSPCILATYFTLGFASASPGLHEISRAQRSKPLALLPMLRILLILLHLLEKSCMCFACCKWCERQWAAHDTLLKDRVSY